MDQSGDVLIFPGVVFPLIPICFHFSHLVNDSLRVIGHPHTACIGPLELLITCPSQTVGISEAVLYPLPCKQNLIFPPPEPVFLK